LQLESNDLSSPNHDILWTGAQVYMALSKPRFTPSMPPDSLYYLTNFMEAIDWVVERNHDLLDADELAFAAMFKGLPVPAQALLVRLIMRRGDLFRRSRINYPEIGDVDGALAPLLKLNWIDSEPGIALDELFRLATRKELARHFPILRTRASKWEAYQQLSVRCTDVATFGQWMATEEPVYRVRIAWVITRFRLLFFGTFHQEWSEFVLEQLGIFKFESVEIDHDSRPFVSREDIESFYSLHDCREAFHGGAPMTEVLWLLPEGRLETDWLLEHRERLRFRIGEALERDDDVETALLLYEDCRYQEARVRRALILERQKRYIEAAAAIQAALRDRPTEAEVQKLERIASRVDNHRSGRSKVRGRIAHSSTTLQRCQRLTVLKEGGCYFVVADILGANGNISDAGQYIESSEVETPSRPCTFTDSTTACRSLAERPLTRTTG
jgi:hypothetical protein